MYSKQQKSTKLNEQLSMFAPPAVDRLVEQGVPPRAAQRMVREEAVQCLARAL